MVLKMRRGECQMINLQKGQSIDLTKGNKGLEEVTIGLKWGGVTKGKSGNSEGKGVLARLFDKLTDQPTVTTSSGDIDSSVISLDGNKRQVGRVYFGQKQSAGIRHAGDDRTGSNKFGVEDNEEIYITLNQVPSSTQELYIVANIYHGYNHFGEVAGSYMRLIDTKTKEEMARYELDDFKGKGGVILGKLYRYKGEWKFKTLGDGVDSKELSTIENEILRRY
jgi:tellurium resistance protein TerD